MPDDAWCSHYGNLSHDRVTKVCCTPSSTRSPSESLSDADVEQNGPLSPLTYEALHEGELWRWLWLDFTRTPRTVASKRLMRNLWDSNVAAKSSIREEPVGLSLLPPMGEGSLAAGIFTLVSSAMGAGCLSLPYMFMRSGIVLGVVLLLLGAVLAHVSLVVLMSCARYTGSSSMSSLVSLATGGNGLVVDVVIAIYGLAAVICYLMFIGDFFGGIANSPFVGWNVSRERLILFVSMSIVWPLSLFRKLTALRYVCVLSVSMICFTAIVVVCKIPEQWNAGGFGGHLGGPLRWWNCSFYDTMQCFSISIFAFAAHTNAVPVATSLKSADGKSIWRTSLYSVCIEFVLYLVMGLGGYISFRGNTKQDFILNYSNDDMVMFFVRCVYGGVVCLGAPINLSPAASSVIGLIAKGYNVENIRDWHHSAVVTLIVIGCLLVAMLSEKIADVIGLCGASFGTLIVLAWPALVYRKVFYEVHPPKLACSVHRFLVFSSSVGFAAFCAQVIARFSG